MKIDSRILDADDKFFNYCKKHDIINPFKEAQDRFNKRCHYDGKCTIIEPETEEDIVWRQEWEKRRDEYLRLEHTFRLWNFHFWMPWERFKKHLEWSKKFADISIYMPCDTAERQCDMACTYFGGNCPREKEPLKCPIKEYEE